LIAKQCYQNRTRIEPVNPRNQNWTKTGNKTGPVIELVDPKNKNQTGTGQKPETKPDQSLNRSTPETKPDWIRTKIRNKTRPQNWSAKCNPYLSQNTSRKRL
jgi:hypothetical protein